MPEYVLVPGKNFSLSTAEIACYFGARKIPFEILDWSEESRALVVRAERPPVMRELGGALKIGEVLAFSEGIAIEKIIQEIWGKFDFRRFFSSLPEKALFGISAYDQMADAKALAEFFKREMKEYGIKAGYVHNTPLTHTEILKKKLLEKGAEFLACRGRKFWLARTTAVHNPYEFQKRDTGRPVQRAIFSIPPRLSRIMVNLTNCTEGVLLDPFCGMGSILQEAALAGFDVRGVDIDNTCVEGCKKNLAWLEKEYKLSLGNLDNKIFAGDARKLGEYFAANSIDAIATEPYLGEPLKGRPTMQEAKRILGSLEPLFEESLREMSKILKPKSRVIIVSPFFEMGDGVLQMDVAAITGKCGLKVVDPLEKQAVPHGFPFTDFEERHRTLRMINVLEKV